MTKWVKLEQFDKFRKLHHFTVMQETRNSYYDVQNLRQYLVSFHNIDINIDILPSPKFYFGGWFNGFLHFPEAF